MAEHVERFELFTDPVDGTSWRIDVGFVESNWECKWGNGCVGILDYPAAELEQGCCSVGAGFVDDDEARRIGTLALTLDPDRFQFHAEAEQGGVFTNEQRSATRVVEDACIFLNRPGFAGGAGCALHLAATDDDESPLDWKPSVCWQLPLKVDHEEGRKTLRRWNRSDWGDDARDIAWCCTEQNGEAGLDGEDGSMPSAYTGDKSVAESLHAELAGLLGPEIAVELRSRSRKGAS